MNVPAPSMDGCGMVASASFTAKTGASKRLFEGLSGREPPLDLCSEASSKSKTEFDRLDLLFSILLELGMVVTPIVTGSMSNVGSVETTVILCIIMMVYFMGRRRESEEREEERRDEVWDALFFM